MNGFEENEINEISTIIENSIQKEKKEKNSKADHYRLFNDLIRPNRFNEWNSYHTDSHWKFLILNGLLDILVKDEEYEKCSIVKDWISNT